MEEKKKKGRKRRVEEEEREKPNIGHHLSLFEIFLVNYPKLFMLFPQFIFRKI